jgi:flagellar basal-body rod modification protein FlgD
VTINDITSTPIGSSGASASASTGSAQPTSDEFLRLFVAQLEHQDPLQPQEGADFIAQLAQFASVEQAAAMNARLDAIAAQQAAAGRASMLGLVGKPVEVAADSITLTGEGTAPPPLTTRLDAPAGSVDVVIRDASGKEVRRIELGAHAAGDVAVNWDGKGPNGTDLPKGTYSIEVEAKTAGGGEVGAHLFARGTVDAVSFADGGTRIRLGNCFFNPSDIVSVG